MERRLAAVLSADVVGYSRLMAADEEGTHARLKAHRGALLDPTIAGYGGRVVKLTGDGALVEFPSVVQAVQCALEFQRGMAARNAEVPEVQQIALRIGINIGDIIIEDDDIDGDGVNVAVRLQQLGGCGRHLRLAQRLRSGQDQTRLSLPADRRAFRQETNPRRVRAYRVLVDPNLLATGHPAQSVGLQPAEAARQEWMEQSATAARQLRAMLAANEAITQLLWEVAAAADLVRVDDEIESATADLRTDAIAPVEAERRLAANQKRAAARESA
jgi:class 3 adenylate cyclase